ncbi:MAG TPA: FixH family protein [Bacteroidales bacterium]|nr:FixH family protein [Bacteroidales bacterium]HPS61737.1 FixH family protein [Bacteroidales bacterium]
MKWNWGTGIFLFIVLFVAACIAFLIYSRSQMWSLVEDDYYPKELRHEEKLVKIRNANALIGTLAVRLAAGNLEVEFPSDFRGQHLSGQVWCYRPSDERMDIRVPVDRDTMLVYRIPVQRLNRGRYVVKAEWSCNGRDYYEEKDIMVP